MAKFQRLEDTLDTEPANIAVSPFPAAAGPMAADDGAIPPLPKAPKNGLKRARDWLKKSPDLLGLGYNIISTMFFSVVSLQIKVCSTAGIGSFALVFARSVVQLVLGVLFMLVFVRKNPFGPFKNRKVMLLLLIRGTVGIMSMSGYFVSIRMLPLSDAVLVSFLGPVFTAFFGFVVLRERISILEIGGMAFSFMGIFLVARPAFIFDKLGFREPVASSDVSSEVSAAAKMRLIGAAIGITGTFFAGLAYVLTRKIGKAVHPTVVVNWLSVCGMVYSVVPSYFLEKFVLPQGIVWMYVVGIGVFAFGGQMLLTLALQTGTAARVTVANYLSIVWAFFWSTVLLHDKIALLSIIGSCLIAVNAGIAAYKGITHPSKKPTLSVAHVDVLSVPMRPITATPALTPDEPISAMDIEMSVPGAISEHPEEEHQQK